MEMLFTSFFWVTLAEIVMINILLSGDNAVVIALASRSLPPKQQKLAILYGSMGAVLLRIVLTFFAVVLLDFPMLKIIGGVLLVWIGIKMLIPEGDTDLDAHDNLLAAIKTIIVADLIMSLDNVLGVAAAAKGNTALLVIGLAISIPLIIYGSTLVIKLMERFGFIVTLGAALLGWVAGEMLITDPMIANWTATDGSWTHTTVPMAAAVFVVLVGSWFASKANRKDDLVPASPFGPQLALAGDASLMFEDDTRHMPPMKAPAAVATDAEVTERAVEENTAIFDDHPAQDLTESATADPAESEAPPPGYRWVTRRWKTLPGGGRDYAALHGMKTFRWLVPVSSRLYGLRFKRHE